MGIFKLFFTSFFSHLANFREKLGVVGVPSDASTVVG
jgi:hypothetical protein